MNPRLSFTKGIARDPASGRYHTRVQIDGRRVQRWFETRRAAEVYLIAARQDQVAASLGLIVDDQGMTIDGAFEEYIGDAEVRGLAQPTLRGYRQVRTAVVRHFGTRKGCRLDRRDVQGYAKHRRNRSVKGSRIEAELKFLQTVLRHTVGQSFLTWEVPRMVDPDQAAPRAIVGDDEIASSYHAVAGRPDVQRAIVIALLTALRQTDVLRLTSSDLTDGVLIVGMSKRRGQPIAVPVVETLAAHLEGVEGKYTPTHDSMRMYMRRRTPWYGVGHLRAVAATWASEAGFDDDEVSALLGHARHSIARTHYIRAPRVLLRDPYLDTRRAMLETVEARFLEALDTP